ncbi:MAG: transposase [Planctomycetia bacterium]
MRSSPGSPPPASNRCGKRPSRSARAAEIRLDADAGRPPNAPRPAGRRGRRWEVETDLRLWKRTLGVDALRGRSVEMVLKEVAMGALAYNLVVEVRRLAAAPPKRISYTGVWSLVTITLFSPRERTAEKWREHVDRVLRWAAQRKLPNRPGRSYPRQVPASRRRFFKCRRRRPGGPSP